MKYVLQDTNLFDEEIGNKLNEILKLDIEKFDKDKIYELTVSFHVSLLDHPKIDSFFIPEPSPNNKGSRKDRMYDCLKTQLERCRQVLVENGVESDFHTIQGDELDSQDMIIFEIQEDLKELKFASKGEKEKKYCVYSIIPSNPAIKKMTEDCMRALFYKILSQRKQIGDPSKTDY